MSEVAIAPAGGNADAFSPKTAIAVAVIGVIAFAAMLVLAAYAPDLQSGKNGGSHALSNAATGYSGLVRLAEATRRSPTIVRSVRGVEDNEALLVVTPEQAATDLSELLDARGASATLVVLPKWSTVRDRQKPAWVRSNGLLSPSEPQGILAPATRLRVNREIVPAGTMLQTLSNRADPAMRFPAPRVVQSVTGPGVVPIVADGAGRAVLARVGDGNFYVLADPDLINNRGLADPRRAAAALAMLDFLNATDAEEVLFDVTANGLGAQRSPLKLAFDPPFLGVTLVLALALLLAGIQALFRFGPPLRPERAIAFGKRALVDNVAGLIRKAGREAHFGGRYAAAIRERAATFLRLPTTLSPAEIDERLDRLPAQQTFSVLARAAGEARTRGGLVAAALALHQWKKEIGA